MSMSSGQVLVNDEPTKNKLYRFCEKKIDQWLKSHIETNANPTAEGTDEQPTEAEFRVYFTEEGDTNQVSCMTEISLKGALWRGCDLASDEQQALIHSLKRLQPH